MALLKKSEEELQQLAAEQSLVWKDLKTFNGYTMPSIFENYWRCIEDLEVYDDDVWVTGFPRSGITWTQEMVWCLCNDVDLEAAKQDIQQRFPLLEFTTRMGSVKFLIGFMSNSIEVVKNLKRPRFIKTHLPWELLPKQITTFQRRPKIIHVTRNPKDVCVSHFHFSRLVEGYKGGFDVFWQLFIRSKLPWTPYSFNVLSYWKQRQERNLFFIKYEDMNNDLLKVVKDTGTFLNVELREDQVTKLLEHLHFDTMKSNNAVNYSGLVQYLKLLNFSVDKQGQFLRNGSVGSYSDLMSPEIVRLFDEKIGSDLKKSDVEL